MILSVYDTIMSIRFSLLALFSAAFLLGCGRRAQELSSDFLLVLAAASTAAAVEEIVEDFGSETGLEVRVSSGGSNTLARQVLAGVSADIFLSAHPAWVLELERHGLTVEWTHLLSNRLVLIVPVGNPAGVGRATDLTGDRVRIVALAGESVPVGRYAEDALSSAGVYRRLMTEGRIARGSNSRSTLAFVEVGEADAGVVYLTDALASGRVEIVKVIEHVFHSPIGYPVALLSAAANDDRARLLYEFFQSEAAARVFYEHGFFTSLFGDATGF
jgi:molybdate transport system substrate-binding protein